MQTKARSTLTIELCQGRAIECRALSAEATLLPGRIMLQHIADTWERVAERMREADG